MRLYSRFLFSFILWDICKKKNSIAPLPGQPSFCLKVTSSLALALFKTQDDLSVKRCLCSCTLSTETSVWFCHAFSILSFHVVKLTEYLPATRAIVHCSESELKAGWRNLTSPLSQDLTPNILCKRSSHRPAILSFSIWAEFGSTKLGKHTVPLMWDSSYLVSLVAQTKGDQEI